jgi:hypothetical protein
VTKVQITARLFKEYRPPGKKKLKVVSPVFDRQHIPMPGDRLRIGEVMETVEFHRTLHIVRRTLTWGADGSDFYELEAEADFRELTNLAIVSNWHVADGLSELSKYQRDFIACATGTCNHTNVRKAA